MATWISIENAERKYELNFKKLILWAEMHAIKINITDMDIFIDEENLTTFLEERKNLINSKYVQNLETFGITQLENTQTCLQIIEHQKRSLKEFHTILSALEKNLILITEDCKLRHGIVDINLGMESKTKKGRFEKFKEKFRRPQVTKSL